MAFEVYYIAKKSLPQQALEHSLLIKKMKKKKVNILLLINKPTPTD